MTYDLLLALHFLGLFMGGAGGLGLPVLGATIQAAPVEHRPSIGKAVRPLRLIGQSGVGLLIVTGPILLVMGGANADSTMLFSLKLALVAALVVSIAFATRAGIRAMTGDMEAAAKAGQLGKLNIALVVAIVVTAALVFH